MKTTTYTLLAAVAIAVTGCGDFGGEPDDEARDGTVRSLLDGAGSEPDSEPEPEPRESAPATPSPDVSPPPAVPDLDDTAQSVTQSVFDLSVGDCLVELEQDPMTTVEVVPCDELHEAQLVSTYELPEGPWPGLAEMEDSAEEQCFDAITGLSDAAGLDVTYLYPTALSWEQGDREIACLVSSDDPRRGSLPVG